MNAAPVLPSWRLWTPRYWPTALLLALLWSLTALPFSTQLALGKLLGHAAYYVLPARRRIAAANLALCFPDLSPAERHALLKRNFVSLGQGVLETAMSWWAPADKLMPLAHIQGLEHLHRAQARGKGVLLLSAHFTTFEIAGRMLAEYIPFHVLYRLHKNALFEHVTRKNRERRFESAIPRHDMRALLRSLKANYPVWYAPDQNYGREHSIFAPFFGIPTSTITATARIAKLSGASVVPFFPRRLEGNTGYLLTLLPALENFPSGDIEQDTARINEIIEAEIRALPEQYLWVHRRFKTRPPGLAAVYR